MDQRPKSPQSKQAQQIFEKGTQLTDYISVLVSDRLLAMHGRPPAQFNSKFKKPDETRHPVDLSEKSCRRILLACGMTLVMMVFGVSLVGGIIYAFTKLDDQFERVTVADVPSYLKCPGNIVRRAAPGQGHAVVSWEGPVYDDGGESTANGSFVIFESNYESNSSFKIGTHEVVYTVTDSKNVEETCSFQVRVTDEENPVFETCPRNIEVVTEKESGHYRDPTWDEPRATDNGGTPIITTNYHGESFDIGATEIHYTAMDNTGNIARCIFEVTIIDGTPPVISDCPEDVTVTAGRPEWTVPKAEDNVRLVSFGSNWSPGDTFPLGLTRVSYVAVDSAGLRSECSFNVAVFDLEVPVFVDCPTNITVLTDENGAFTAPTWDIPRATDNTGPPRVVRNRGGRKFKLGQTTEIAYTATDDSGNEATCRFYVTVKDGTPPIIVGCPSNISQPNDRGTPSARVYWTPPIARDNSDFVHFNSNGTPGDFFPLGITTVMYTAVDAEGLRTECSFIVQVKDVEAPKFTYCPLNIEKSTDDDGSFDPPTWPTPRATDNAGPPQVTATHPDGNFILGEKRAVKYVATDISGNNSTCQFYVLIIDETPPVIKDCPRDIAVPVTPQSQTGRGNWTAPTATDNSDHATLTSSANPGDAFRIGRTRVTYTAVDSAGLTDTCHFTVSVQDLEVPVFVDCPTNFTVLTDENGAFTAPTWDIPRATDNTGPPRVVRNRGGRKFKLGQTKKITYTATDDSGNEATCRFYVTVKDATPPTIGGCPSNISLPNDRGRPSAQVYWTPPVAMDNGEFVDFNSNGVPGDIFQLGRTRIVYIAVDSEGLRAECSFIVKIIDVEAPRFTDCPPNIEKSTDDDGSFDPPTWPTPRATDNAGPPQVTATHPDGSFILGEKKAVKYVATDISGNNSTCQFYVLIIDATPPIVTDCPGDLTLATDPRSPTGRGNWTTPTATDNSDHVTLTSSANPGDAFRIGRKRVTYTAMDSAGLMDQCHFTITVLDNEAPVFTQCPSDFLLKTDMQGQYKYPIWKPPQAADNSGEPPLISTRYRSMFFELNSRTWIEYDAVDAAGNNATCLFLVSVTDGTPPLLEDCPADMTVSTDPNSSTSRVNWSIPTVSDNSKEVNLTISKIPGDQFPLGRTKVTYWAVDPSGLTSECHFFVTVQDGEEPVFTNCPSDIERVTGEDGQYDYPTWDMPRATDNGGPVQVTTAYDFAPFQVGVETTIAYIATDSDNNTASCVFYVTIIDGTPPVITNCPSSVQVPNDPRQPTGQVNWTEPTAEDNGGYVQMTSNRQSGDRFPLGKSKVVYVATDGTGWITKCRFNVIVKDTEPPVFDSCPSDIVRLTDASGLFDYPIWTYPHAIDNSGRSPAITTTHQFHMFPLDEVTPIEYFATDRNGNTATCRFHVTVKDMTPPVINMCPGDMTLSIDPRSATGRAVWVPPTASDNARLVSFQTDWSPGDVFPPGETSVTYVATDTAGLTSQCQFTVIVEARCNLSLTTPALRNSYSYRFPFPASLQMDDRQVLHFDFAVRSKGTVFIALTEDAASSAVYEIGLGSSKSFVRCGILCKPRYLTIGTRGLISPSEYRRFWITYDNNGLIRVGQGSEEPFLEWQDPSPTPLDIQRIGIASYQEADWKGYLCKDETYKPIGWL